MKKLFKIHLFFYITSIILLFSGHFKEYIYFMLIILIHEIGHIIAGKLFKWEINKIVILPFGCITYFKTSLNTKIKKEFIVTIMGPLFQIIGCIVIYLITKNKIIFFYNNLILLLNLLPIIPLDGSKILNCILYKFFPYYKSLKISIIFSYMFLILIFIYQIKFFNLLIVIWLLLLLIEIIKEQKNKNMKFYLFLRERFDNYYNFPYKYVAGVNVKKIKKDYKMIFKNKNHYYSEYEVLKKYFLGKLII